MTNQLLRVTCADELCEKHGCQKWRDNERSAINIDENSQPFSIRKICRLTPKWRKGDFKSLIKGLK